MRIEVAAGPLAIRSWRESDAESLAAAVLENLEHLRPWLPWVEPLRPDGAAMLAAMRAYLVESVPAGEDVGVFLDGALVGGAGLHPRIGPGGLEIGYWVHRDFTGRGVATAAAAALTGLAFSRPSIDRVEIHHDKANAVSGRIPRRLGFTLVGEEPREVRAPGEIGVECVWRVTRAQWSARGA